MGDLVIKPESGGSIKLQNNAGTNALVSDNSGNIALAGTTTLTNATITAGTFPAGHVLQVVSTSDNVAYITTSGAERDMITVDITPFSTSSKILILISAWTGTYDPNGGWTLNRNSTPVGTAATQYGGSTGSFLTYDDNISPSVYVMVPMMFNFLDSPGLTSTITYALHASSMGHMSWNATTNGTSGYSTSTMTAMEVAG